MTFRNNKIRFSLRHLLRALIGSTRMYPRYGLLCTSALRSQSLLPRHYIATLERMVSEKIPLLGSS